MMFRAARVSLQRVLAPSHAMEDTLAAQHSGRAQPTTSTPQHSRQELSPLVTKSSAALRLVISVHPSMCLPVHLSQREDSAT